MLPRVRVWSRDNAGYAKVRRIGFSVAPEFGGTIHGYCGDTLDAALLDLLEWNRKPTIDDQHKAYVGRSRTRKVEDTLLVQPYSPWLFRQGELAGPTILMEVLRGKLNTSRAKSAWKESVKKREKEKEKAAKGPWLKVMPLPCRSCSTAKGEDVWKSLSFFNPHYNTVTDMWKHVVSKGQDLCCSMCKSVAFQKKFGPGGKQKKNIAALLNERDQLIHCNGCKDYHPPVLFDDDMVDAWNAGTGDDLRCKKCLGQSIKREDMEFF